jgi:hypothetical protein
VFSATAVETPSRRKPPNEFLALSRFFCRFLPYFRNISYCRVGARLAYRLFHLFRSENKLAVAFTEAGEFVPLPAFNAQALLHAWEEAIYAL